MADGITMSESPDLVVKAGNEVAWHNLLFQLGEAGVHLQGLIDQMSADECIDEIDFGIQLGHVYGHLNRCWNGRRLPGEPEDQWYSDENSSFPEDLQIT